MPAVAGRSIAPPDPDSSLIRYAVKVIHNRPFEKPFIGYGIYLGNGIIITAAHVLGRWPSFFSNPRVAIAGRELPATIIKAGSPETTDLALLSVEVKSLPIYLRWRLNPLCKMPAQTGQNVIVVVPQGLAHSHILAPQMLPPKYQSNSNTFIGDLWIPGGSGSGVFDSKTKCLLGIITTEIVLNNYRIEHGHADHNLARSTFRPRHFVPAAIIRQFVPPALRF